MHHHYIYISDSFSLSVPLNVSTGTFCTSVCTSVRDGKLTVTSIGKYSMSYLTHNKSTPKHKKYIT